MTPFIHLAVRSSYSLLESMITAKQLFKWAEEAHAPALAVTDRNNMFGALELSLGLSGAGVQPIIACCFDVLDEEPKSEQTRRSIYAQNQVGYQRLMYLSSQAYLESETGVPALAQRHVFENTDGLIVLTGGAQGAVARCLLKGKQSDARDVLYALSAAYPGRCYVEITRHGTPEEAKTEAGLIELAYALGLPLVATHDARFLKPTDAGAHDALMCIANGE